MNEETKELELYLEQIKNTVVMRVIKQEGITESLSENIKVADVPDISIQFGIWLRGCNSEYDNITVCLVTESEQQAEEYLQKVIGWLNDVFYKEVEPKRGDVVS